jgi:hypothetical protein
VYYVFYELCPWLQNSLGTLQKCTDKVRHILALSLLITINHNICTLRGTPCIYIKMQAARQRDIPPREYSTHWDQVGPSGIKEAGHTHGTRRLTAHA